MKSISSCYAQIQISILLSADIYAIAGNSGSNGGYSTFNDMTMFENYGRISAMKVCIGWYIDRLALDSIYVRTVGLYMKPFLFSQVRNFAYLEPSHLSRTIRPIISCLLCSGTVIIQSSFSQINTIIILLIMFIAQHSN